MTKTCRTCTHCKPDKLLDKDGAEVGICQKSHNHQPKVWINFTSCPKYEETK